MYLQCYFVIEFILVLFNLSFTKLYFYVIRYYNSLNCLVLLAQQVIDFCISEKLYPLTENNYWIAIADPVLVPRISLWDYTCQHFIIKRKMERMFIFKVEIKFARKCYILVLRWMSFNFCFKFKQRILCKYMLLFWRGRGLWCSSYYSNLYLCECWHMWIRKPQQVHFSISLYFSKIIRISNKKKDYRKSYSKTTLLILIK